MSLLLLTLLACGYSPEDFAVDYADATCGLYSDCGYLESFGFDGLGACTSSLEATYGPEGVTCADYDGKLSEQCVEGVLAMTCDDLYANDWPTECADRCGAPGDDVLGDDSSGDGGSADSGS